MKSRIARSFPTKMPLMVMAVSTLGNLASAQDWKAVTPSQKRGPVLDKDWLRFQTGNSEWNFYEVSSPSAGTFYFGMDSAPGTAFFPRIRVEVGPDDTTKECSILRPLGRRFAEATLNADGMQINWTGTGSGYFGWSEACEEYGTITQDGSSVGLVRYVNVATGSRQATYLLIQPDGAPAANDIFEELICSSGPRFFSIDPLFPSFWVLLAALVFSVARLTRFFRLRRQPVA